MKLAPILKRIITLEIAVASLLLLMPLILFLVTGEWRSSISNYAYSDESYWFVLLMTLAGFLFIFNGVIRAKKFYNIALGAMLLIIAVTPHLSFPIVHYSAAIQFFMGSVIVMIAYSSKGQRWFKIIAGAIIIIALLVHFLFNTYSLLVAEWIGMVPISLHFIGESLNKID